MVEASFPPRPIEALLDFWAFAWSAPPGGHTRGIGDQTCDRRGKHGCCQDANPFALFELPGDRHPNDAGDHEPWPVAEFADTCLKTVVVGCLPALDLGLNDASSHGFIKCERCPGCATGEQHEQPERTAVAGNASPRIAQLQDLARRRKVRGGSTPWSLVRHQIRGLHLGRSQG